MRSNALVLYVDDGNFSIVENNNDDNKDIGFLQKYLHIPNDYVETLLYDVTDKFGDNYVLIKNTSYLGKYKIKNENASNLIGEDVYWHCAVMKVIDPSKPLYDLEFGRMEEEDIVKIFNMCKKNT
jgi:hypothetical protein